MTREQNYDELNEAIDTILEEDEPVRSTDPELDVLARLAWRLRGLPDPDFKAVLRAELLARGTVGGQRTFGWPSSLKRNLRLPFVAGMSMAVSSIRSRSRAQIAMQGTAACGLVAAAVVAVVLALNYLSGSGTPATMVVVPATEVPTNVAGYESTKPTKIIEAATPEPPLVGVGAPAPNDAKQPLVDVGAPAPNDAEQPLVGVGAPAPTDAEPPRGPPAGPPAQIRLLEGNTLMLTSEDDVFFRGAEVPGGRVAPKWEPKLLENGVPVDAVDIDGKAAHACAVTRPGGAKCWGRNQDGQLGTGRSTSVPVSFPQDVLGLHRKVLDISTGYSHTCALTSEQTVVCWGQNEEGQVGALTTETCLGEDFVAPRHREPCSTTPIDVCADAACTEKLDNVSDVSAGGGHTCALTTSGGVKCWGDNRVGQLGDGTTDSSHVPVDVTGLEAGVTAIAAGSAHTCAVIVGGDLMCWGQNLSGQLGADSQETCPAFDPYSHEAQEVPCNTTPTYVCEDAGCKDRLGGVIEVSAGGGHTCARTIESKAKCWGANQWGQLRRSKTEDECGLGGLYSCSRRPLDIAADVAMVVAGPYATCAITDSERNVVCWPAQEPSPLPTATSTPTTSLTTTYTSTPTPSPTPTPTPTPVSTPIPTASPAGTPETTPSPAPMITATNPQNLADRRRAGSTLSSGGQR